MATANANVHGRKPGRGVRPWLLVPKVLAVAAYFGSALTAAILWWTRPDLTSSPPPVPTPQSPGTAAPATVPESVPTSALDSVSTESTLDTVSFIVRFIMVPALLVAIIFGLLLFAQHAGTFARLRWWRVKMISLVILIPAMHFYMSSRLVHVRDALAAHTAAPDAARQLDVGFIALIIGSAWLILLGRHKPRLRQNIVRALAARRSAQT